jgi:YVTN family beta-propeller protein
MKIETFILALCQISTFAFLTTAQAQAPALAGTGATISDADRIYTGDQTSNTITVIKASTHKVLGTISLGDVCLTDVIGPQYIQSVNSHGLGFSCDGKYTVSLSITSNTVTVVRTLDNATISRTFVDRAPHEAFFSTDNRTVWVGTRGVDRIDIVDGLKGGIIGNISSPGGPSKVLFSPDSKTAYANHIRSATVSIIDVNYRVVTSNITGPGDVFSSNMMLSPDGKASGSPTNSQAKSPSSMSKTQK